MRKPTRKPARQARGGPRRKPVRAQLAMRRQHAVDPPATHAWPVHGTPFTDREYRKLYDFAPVNWLVLDGAAIILDVNLNCGQTLGASPRLLIGTPLRMFTAEDSRQALIDHMRRCRDQDAPVETELTLRTRQGLPVSVRLYSRRIVFDGAHLYPTAAIDITLQRAMERAQQRAEAARDRADAARQTAQAAEAAKDRLIARVSHELRNPLSPALLAAAALQQMAELPARAKSMAAMISRNIELEARLIDDLLDMARASRGQLDLRMNCVDLHDIVRNAVHVCSPTAAAKSVTITSDLDAEQHFVYGDSARLQQVVWNLLNNAIKFSARGGELLVRTDSDEEGLIRVSVRDFGIGMTQDIIDNLFSPFEQPRATGESRAGLGLGLTIAKSIIDAHGGRIWAYSDGLDRGSLFEVELTTAPAPVATPNADATNTKKAAQRPHGRLLVVEDDADTGSTLASCLEERGYSVRLVSTLADGLRALDEPWQAILSDINLPDGSGLDIARAARRSIGPRTVLVALSGFGMTGDLKRSRDAGFDAHLVKPVGADEVVRVLEQVPAT